MPNPFFIAAASAVLASSLGGLALVRLDIADRRDRFLAEAALVQRRVGEQAARHDAILATLDSAAGGRLQPAAAALQAVYPQIAAIHRRPAGQDWSAGALDAALRGAEDVSRATAAGGQRPVPAMTALDPVSGRYGLVLAGPQASHALVIDSRRMADDGAVPFGGGGLAEVSLVAADRALRLRDGADPSARPFGLTAGFRAQLPIDSPSQPFVLDIRQATGPAQWPWGWLAAWALGCGLASVSWLALHRARSARRLAAERARIDRIARLNSLGELAAGIAHELNQPLAAVLASSQAALRAWPATAAGPGAVDRGAGNVDGDAADAALARSAVEHAARQARRAADVLARLRRLVEPARAASASRIVEPHRLASRLVDLLAPEIRRAGVSVRIEGRSRPVRADPVAVEQVLHNLVGNALQAFERTDAAASAGGAAASGTSIAGASIAREGPAIVLRIADDGDTVRIAVRDNGPGIAAQDLPRLFEPFFTTRDGGLGLGLALCETLVRAQGGRIAAHRLDRGAEFVVSLPAATAPAGRADESDARRRLHNASRHLRRRPAGR